MLFFLYGADTFRLRQKLEQIIAEYKNRSKGIDFAVFDGLGGQFGDFFANLRQNSLFGEKKFFVIKNPVSNAAFKEALIKKIDLIAASAHNFVFFQEGKVLKADRLLKAVLKCGQTQEFLPLEGADLISWIIKEFGSLGKAVDAVAAEILAARLGSDLWRMANEIQKLAHFVSEQKILVKDIENYAPDINAEIFKTIDAIAGRDKRRGIKMIKDHCAKGDHPLYLLAMIAGQFRNLLLLKDAKGAVSAVRLGIHPYVFGKTANQAGKFSLADLRSNYCKIIATDFQIKTGRIDPFSGLDILLAGF